MNNRLTVQTHISAAGSVSAGCALAYTAYILCDSTIPITISFSYASESMGLGFVIMINGSAGSSSTLTEWQASMFAISYTVTVMDVINCLQKKKIIYLEVMREF